MDISLKGLITALITPFTLVESEGASYKPPELDLESLKKLIEWQLESGVDGFVALGSTGEAAALSEKEREQVVKVFVESVAGKVPVVVGVTSSSTEFALEMTLAASEQGADAVLVASPPYVKPQQRGIFKHFEVLAEASRIPVVLYDIPSRTGASIEVDTMVSLAKHPNIIGLKDAGGSLAKTEELISKLPQSFSLLSGDDDKAYEAILMGAEGLISASGSAFPIQMRRLVEQAVADRGLAAEARNEAPEIVGLVREIADLMFLESNPAPVKAALGAKGLIADSSLRLPLLSPKPENLERIESFTKALV